MTEAKQQKYIDIVKKIDADVNKVFSGSKSDKENDTAILGVVQNHMLSFKVVLDGVGQAGLDNFCERYQGFWRFAKFMERFAQAVGDGAFRDILKR